MSFNAGNRQKVKRAKQFIIKLLGNQKQETTKRENRKIK